MKARLCPRSESCCAITHK